MCTDPYCEIRYYTVAEVAEMWKVSVSFIYIKIHEGLIHITELGRGRAKWRITGAELRRLNKVLTPTL